MNFAALLAGLLFVAIGALGIVEPGRLIAVAQFFQSPPEIYLAAAIRIAIGIILIRAAKSSHSPLFLRALGVVLLIGGMLTPFVGSRIAQAILDWWSAIGPAGVRAFAAVATILGACVVYAVAPTRRTA